MMDATYTAERLRRDAVAIERMHGETLTVEWRAYQASQLRSFADALEENARLKAELGRFSDRNVYALRQRAERAEAELAKLRQHAEAMAKELESIRDLDGWYFQSVTDLVRAFRADFPEEK